VAVTPDLRRRLLDLEERVAAPAARSSREDFEELLVEDFVEFGSNGKILDRDDVIAGYSVQAPRAWSIADFRVTDLSENVALVTYIATQSGSGSSLRSSVWKRSGKRWRMVFHQGTRMRKAAR
jgi:hypothetical protein